MADTGGATCQVGRQLRIARGYHRPTVNKYLGADLFSYDLAIQGNRSTCRRLNTFFEPQIRRMLGRISQATPPEDGTFFDEIVEPGLANLSRRNIRIVAIVRQRS